LFEVGGKSEAAVAIVLSSLWEVLGSKITRGRAAITKHRQCYNKSVPMERISVKIVALMPFPR